MGEQKQEAKSFFTLGNTANFIMTALGLLLTIISFEHKDILFIIGCILIILGVVVYIIRYVMKLKMDLNYERKNVKLLLEQATNGMKETYNSVKITYDDDKQLYFFEFKKHFTITSDISPIRYSAQFYANKYPTDVNLARSFYDKEENKIEWKDLNVKATMKYKRPNETECKEELVVSNHISFGNIMPFDICFKTKDGTISLPKDTEIELKYCYKVKRKLWGTYINRSMGFFNVDAIVHIVYDSKFPDLKLYVSHLVPPDGEPELLNIKPERDDGDKKEFIFTIPTDRFSRYRVYWRAKECFGGEEDTKDGSDKLKLTNK